MAGPTNSLGRVPAWLGRVRTWTGRATWRWPQRGAGAEARRQEALAALGQLALEGADSKDLVEHAAALVARILDVPFSTMLVWEPDGCGLRVRAGVGWKAGVVGRAVIDCTALPAAAAVWRSPQPLVFEALEREASLADVPLLRGHEIVSGVSVVVAPRGRPYGVLAAYTGRARRFTAAEVAFLRSAAKILGIALGREYGERALFEEMQMSTVLAQVGREIMSCTEVPVLLDRICRLTVQALHCDHSVTWLRRTAEESFRPAAADGLPAHQWEMLGSVVLPAETAAGVLAELAHRETVRIDARTDRYPFLSSLLVRSGIREALLAPLNEGDHVVGLQMSGHRERGDEFSAHDERVAHGIGQLAGMALMNARAVEELERASQLKSEFVSTMSHELRTPLNIIIGYTDMLHDAATPEEQASLLALVRKASHELLEMIDGTLNLNRLAAGGDVPRFAPVVVSELWHELEEDFRALPRKTPAELRWEPCDGIEVQTDRRKLKIVLKNIVGNALKFTPTGEVVARCERIGDDCVFSVRDTGVGIPADALPHVFDMFRQADSSETRSYNGAGLGLYIVRSLLEQLGGGVEAESTVGQGSLFRIVLPAEQPKTVPVPPSDEEAQDPEPPSASIAVSGDAPVCPHGVAPRSGTSDAVRETPARRRLLFADDLPLNRFLVRRFVTREFPEVEMIEASDGEQAVAMFEAYGPDLVLLDLHMPQVDGWEAARRIRGLEGGRETPIVALSVDASPLAEANTVRAGFREFIAKPISDYSAMKSRIAYWLEHRPGARRARRALVVSADCDACRIERQAATAA